MPLTVQEELIGEFTLQINQLTAVADSLKMEKESSLQAFEKYRCAVKLSKIIWSWISITVSMFHFSLLLFSPLLSCTILFSTRLFSTLLFGSALISTPLFSSVLYFSLLFSFPLICSVLFLSQLCSLLFCSRLFCSLLHSSVLFCSVLFCSLLHSSLLFFIFYHLILCPFSPLPISTSYRHICNLTFHSWIQILTSCRSYILNFFISVRGVG